MKSQFAALLREIDGRLPSYFMVKGGRLCAVPQSKDEYHRLIQHGYEHIVDNVDYDSLDRETIEAINTLLNEIGHRALLLFPLAVSAIISHEASRVGSKLHNALHGSAKQEAIDRREEDKRQKRRGK